MNVGLETEYIDVTAPPEAVESFDRGREPLSTSREDLRWFLLACHQASVSVEAMSTYLGIDADTIRSELLLGIEAWNEGQRRNVEVTAGER